MGNSDTKNHQKHLVYHPDQLYEKLNFGEGEKLKNNNGNNSKNKNIINSIMINPDVLVGKGIGTPMDYYTIIGKLREGEYGIVWKFQNKITNHICAMKKIVKKVLEKNKKLHIFKI